MTDRKALGADHLTLERGGGGWVILKQKKIPASASWKKKIACSTNEIERKFLHCCKQEKKMLQSYRAPVAQLVEHTREVVSSTPAGPTLRVFK